MNSLITKRCSPIEEAIYQQGFQAGTASRDAEVVSLTNQRDYEYVRAENAEQERDQLREQVKVLLEFDGEALLALYRFLRHPMQAGPMWVRYRRQGVDGALDVVESLMKKHGFEFKPANEPEAR